SLKSPIWPRKGEDAWEFDIVGIYDGAKKITDTTGFFFRYDYFDEARVRGQGSVGLYMIRVNNPDHAGDVAKLIDAEFANSPYETKAEPEGAFVQGFIQQIGDIGMIVMLILTAVFSIFLLAAGNTMAQAVHERTEELGVMKALGFSNGRVLALVLFESCLLAAAGGLAGIVTTLLITALGSPSPTVLPIWYFPQQSVLLGLALIIAFGVVAGILP